MWAIIYEVKLVDVPEENVLHNISYFGQSLPKYKNFNRNQFFNFGNNSSQL